MFQRRFASSARPYRRRLSNSQHIHPNHKFTSQISIIRVNAPKRFDPLTMHRPVNLTAFRSYEWCNCTVLEECSSGPGLACPRLGIFGGLTPPHLLPMAILRTRPIEPIDPYIHCNHHIISAQHVGRSLPPSFFSSCIYISSLLLSPALHSFPFLYCVPYPFANVALQHLLSL